MCIISTIASPTTLSSSEATFKKVYERIIQPTQMYIIIKKYIFLDSAKYFNLTDHRKVTIIQCIQGR